MDSSRGSLCSYRPLDEELRHFRIICEKYKQLQAELARSVQEERAERRALEARLEHALEAERRERARSLEALAAANEYILLDNMTTKLREENHKLKEEVKELKDRAQVEAGMAATRAAGWEERLREAEHQVERAQQGARAAREQAEERAQRDRAALRQSHDAQVQSLRRSHEENVEALRAEIQSVRNECIEQVNVAALEFEERAAQLTDCIATAEAEKVGLRKRLSEALSRVAMLQLKLDETLRSLDHERARLGDANRAMGALQRQAAQAAQAAQAVRFQPASAQAVSFQPASAQAVRFQPASAQPYRPLDVERHRLGGDSTDQLSRTDKPVPMDAGLTQPAPPAPRQRRARRKAFEDGTQPSSSARTAPSLFTFKRRFIATAPALPLPSGLSRANDVAAVSVDPVVVVEESDEESRSHQASSPTLPSACSAESQRVSPSGAPADFLRHLAKLPASRKRWVTLSAAAEPRSHNPLPIEPAVTHPRSVESPSKGLDVTRLFFQRKSQGQVRAPSPLPCVGQRVMGTDTLIDDGETPAAVEVIAAEASCSLLSVRDGQAAVVLHHTDSPHSRSVGLCEVAESAGQSALVEDISTSERPSCNGASQQHCPVVSCEQPSEVLPASPDGTEGTVTGGQANVSPTFESTSDLQTPRTGWGAAELQEVAASSTPPVASCISPPGNSSSSPISRIPDAEEAPDSLSAPMHSASQKQPREEPAEKVSENPTHQSVTTDRVRGTSEEAQCLSLRPERLDGVPGGEKSCESLGETPLDTRCAEIQTQSPAPEQMHSDDDGKTDYQSGQTPVKEGKRTSSKDLVEIRESGVQHSVTFDTREASLPQESHVVCQQHVDGNSKTIQVVERDKSTADPGEPSNAKRRKRKLFNLVSSYDDP